MNEFLNDQSKKAKLNWLRAGVLGANDGIVSIAGLVVGVAGATQDIIAIATAGVAGLVAGALSMAVGEYVSVSTQRDAEKSYIEQEEQELMNDPEGALEELAQAYQKRGLSKKTAKLVAIELSGKDALSAHLEVEFGIDRDDLTNPWHAGIASAISFIFGGLIPVAAILLSPPNLRIALAFTAVLPALALTGYVSAKLSEANAKKATLRVIAGGVVAMAVTYGIGYLFGISI